MSKSIVLIGILILSLVVFVGCSSTNSTDEAIGQNDQQEAIGSEEMDESLNDEKPVFPKDKFDIDEKASYRVVDGKIIDEERNLVIVYPQVEGLSDSEKEAKINDILRESVMPWTSDAYANTSLTYEVTKLTDDVLSIRYTGITDVQQVSENVPVRHSINVDIANGEVMSYYTYVTDTSALNDLINEKASEMGMLPFEGEGMKFYIVEDGTVFYYVPADDTAEVVEIFISEEELDGVMQ